MSDTSQIPARANREWCPDCSGSLYSVWATIPRGHAKRKTGNYGRLQRIGAWCWTCENFEGSPE